MRSLLAAFLVLSAAACTGPATPPPNAPAVAVAPGPAPPLPKAGPESFNIDGSLREEWTPLLKAPAIDPAKTHLSAAPQGLSAVPAACDAFVSRKGAPPPACRDATSALA